MVPTLEGRSNWPSQQILDELQHRRNIDRFFYQGAYTGGLRKFILVRLSGDNEDWQRGVDFEQPIHRGPSVLQRHVEVHHQQPDLVLLLTEASTASAPLATATTS